MHAPAVVDAIEAGLRLPFDQGSIRERELFAECVASTESKALRHLFFAEREVAKVPDVPKDTPTREIKRAAVVGAGTMGGGIAMNYANAGIPVLLKEVDQAALDRGMATIRRNYDVTMSKGKMTPAQVEQTMALITPTTSYDGFDQVDIVTEAVFGEHGPEEVHVRGARQGDASRLHPRVELPTLDIDQFASASGRPSQVLGHHYFSPANVMKLPRSCAAARPARRRSRPRSSSPGSSARSASWSATASGSSPTGCSPTTCARPTCCSRRAPASNRSIAC
jgi:3-hydroxyacyl-CoA dehydrogenase